MTIYIDLLFFLNLIYDFLLLLTVNITLKRHIKIPRIIIGSFLGALSTFSIFIPMNKYFLLILKIMIGLVMIIITFKYKNFKYMIENSIYLYMCSVILAGFLYFLKIEFSNLSYLITLLLSPLILFLNIRENRKNKQIVNYHRKCLITFKNNKTLELNGFIDSGNHLKDPITNKYIVLINKKKIKGIYNIRSPMYVPMKTANKNSLLECIGIKNIKIDNKTYDNYLLGLSNDFKTIDECDCLLNYNILEE